MNAHVASDSHEWMTISRGTISCFATREMYSNDTERHTAHTRTPHKLAMISSHMLYDPSYSITYANVEFALFLSSNGCSREFFDNAKSL